MPSFHHTHADTSSGDALKPSELRPLQAPYNGDVDIMGLVAIAAVGVL